MLIFDIASLTGPILIFTNTSPFLTETINSERTN